MTAEKPDSLATVSITLGEFQAMSGAVKLGVDMRSLQKEFFRERNMDKKRDLLAKSKAAEKAFDQAAAALANPQKGLDL